MSAVLKAPVAERPIVLRTRGLRHGPITRLVSPSDIGELIKPFVFLDLFDISESSAPNFGWHPHSGIATLTVLHEGAIEYQETTGVKGILPTGGIEWMRAGGGVWHTGAALQQAKGFQLWIDSRQVNDGPIGHRQIMKLPGSQSPPGPYAHQSPCPPVNLQRSRSPIAPFPLRRTVRRGSFSDPRPNIHTSWYSVTTRFTRLMRLWLRASRRFNASAINSWPLDFSASTKTLNYPYKELL